MEKNGLMEDFSFQRGPSDKWIIDPGKCTGCRECIDFCELGLLVMEGKIVKLKDPTGCSECTDCARICPFKAISFV